jgi:hypothetical protein
LRYDCLNDRLKSHFTRGHFTMFHLGTTRFASKAAARRDVQRILHQTVPETVITDPDAAIIRALLGLHPRAAEKIGAGVSHFTVEWGATFSSRCFTVHRIDGTSTDFSYRKCLDGRTDPLHDAKAALRHEVRDDILHAKRQWFKAHENSLGQVCCPITGEAISIEQSEADHAPPYTFDVLATLFLAANGIEPDETFVLSADNQCGCVMADRDLAERWRSYHHKHADLRIVSRAANQAIANQYRPRPENRQLRLAA